MHSRRRQPNRHHALPDRQLELPVPVQHWLGNRNHYGPELPGICDCNRGADRTLGAWQGVSRGDW